MQLPQNKDDFSDWLDIPQASIESAINCAPSSRYKHFYIPKKNGKSRRIDAPLPDLKKIQSRLSKRLSLLASPSKIATAYIHGRSIFDHALPHRNAKWILTLDFESFFSGITTRKILDISERTFGFNKEISALISNLCTLDGSLPQGAPTSPLLSNIALKPFDEDLTILCSTLRATATRYADDICISSPIETIPEELCRGNRRRLLGSELTSLLRKHELTENKNKTRLSRYPNAHLVTGLRVSENIGVPRKLKRQLRVLKRLLVKDGSNADAIVSTWCLRSFRRGTPASALALIEGKQAFVDYIERRNSALNPL